MKILFLINDNYPNGDAGAIRQHAFATILKNHGHDITILSLNRPQDIALQEYEDISYQAFKGKYLEAKSQLKKYLEHCEVPDILFLNSIPLTAFWYAKRYALKNKVKLVHDCVEWFSLDQFSITHLEPLIRSYLATSLINRFILDKNFKVISISSYLDEYFKRRDIKSLRVPVIMNVKEMSSNKGQIDDKLYIIYAGGAVRRDYIKNIIFAIEMLNEYEKEKLEFTLLGVDINNLSKKIRKSVDEIKKIGWLSVKDRVSRKEVLGCLENNNFTILIRSEKSRYAKAGFPTKVVESLSSGTPVILNITSDLGMYLRNNYDCLTVISEKPSDIAVTIRRALELSKEQKKNMYLNARKTAEDNFDITKYDLKLKEFLEL